jgi:hypothetical protein
MMFFDALARFAETYQPKAIPLVQRAALFHFPVIPHEVLPSGSLTDEQKLELYQNFFLPFDTVVVEDRASCVLLMDTTENQRGWDHRRMFIDVRLIVGDHAAYYDGDDPELRELDKRADLKETFCVIFGELAAMRRHETPEHPHGMAIDGEVTRVFLFDRQECKSIPVDIEVTKGGLQAAKTAVEEIIWANTPSRFIVKETLRKQREEKNGRILRAHDRPKYTLLEPEKIRTLFKLPPLESTGTKRGSHWRRRHERTLRDDCFIHLKGHRIVVKAAWIGPDECVLGNKKYKVCLEL